MIAAEVQVLGTQLGFVTFADAGDYMQQHFAQFDHDDWRRRVRPSAAPPWELAKTADSSHGETDLWDEPCAAHGEQFVRRVPDTMFERVVHALLDRLDRHGMQGEWDNETMLASDAAVIHLDELLRHNAIPMAWNGGFVERGDALVATFVEAPVRDLLRNNGLLSGVAELFDDATSAHARSDAKGAVDNAHRAVERMLHVALEASGTEVPSKATPQTMFDALKVGGHVRRHHEPAVLAASRIRNTTNAGHEARPDPERRDGEVAVAAAATAIVFLGTVLPLEA